MFVVVKMFCGGVCVKNMQKFPCSTICFAYSYEYVDGDFFFGSFEAARFSTLSRIIQMKCCWR